MDTTEIAQIARQRQGGARARKELPLERVPAFNVLATHRSLSEIRQLDLAPSKRRTTVAAAARLDLDDCMTACLDRPC